MLLVGVLGPLESYSPSGQVVVRRSARQRRLLAALALHANAAVDADLLTELIWGDDLPLDPAGALHTNVARLRQTIPPGVEISTAPRSYRLVIDPEAIDAVRFATHLAAAVHAANATERLAKLEAAEALWRGRPYVDLDHAVVTSEVARLTELKLSADEALADALLATGRADEAIGALEALTTRERLRERPVALLMRALVGVGRQSDALRAYTGLREALAEQLGIDPSPELRHLEEQVLRQELDAPTPPPSPPARAMRPTVPVSSFVGRDNDAARVIRLLGGCRIVTVCGPGGVGKSRLARHVAHAVAEQYGDGVIWVELGPLRDPSDVPGALAAELRLNVVDGVQLSDRIADVLTVRRHLIVFDNCEHLAEAVAELVETISVAADGVDLLLTSREPLRVDGEHLITLAPLDELAAVTLLTDRLGAVAPEAISTANDAALLVDIVRRVDRLPLALELAAARVPGLGLQAVRDALDEPYELLREGRRTAANRHRSLLDVVDWSYRLLTEPQRQLFVELAVFVGPVEAEAVVAVCGDPCTDAPEVEILSQLVDRSLVTVAVGDPTTYGMLETLRAFGRRQLSMSPELEELRNRHGRWALSLAEATLCAELTPEQALARGRFDAHIADIRRAREWLSATGRTDELLRLALVLAHHAYHRLRIDLVRLVDETLSDVGDIAHPLRARLLGVSANFGWQRGDLTTAERCCEQAIALARALKDPLVGREAHEAMGAVALMRGDLHRARPEYLCALELAIGAKDTITQMLALCDLGLTASYAGDHESAALYNERLDALAGVVGSPSFLGWASYLNGERRAERDPAEAVPYLDKAVDWAEEVDDRFLAGVARHTLLTTAARMGDPAASLSRFGPLIDHWHTTGAWTQLWLALRALTETLARHGRHREVAILLGALASSARSTPVFGADASRIDAATRAARRALGDEFDALSAQGRAMNEDSVVNFARQLTRET